MATAEFPGNSHTVRTTRIEKAMEPTEDAEAPTEPKKPDIGKVTMVKKPLGERMKKMFFSGSGDSFIEGIIEKVIVPMAKEMVVSVITQTADGFRQGIEEKLFGPNDTRSRSATRGTVAHGLGRPVVNYNTISNTTLRRPETRSAVVRTRRHSNDALDAIVQSREIGDKILSDLDAVINNIGYCTVGDYYDLVGETPRSTDELWGWDDLSGARVYKISHNQFRVTMPPTLDIPAN